MGCKRLDSDFFSFLEVIHSEKRAPVKKIRISGYKYVYQYKDHLGNIRLSYSDTDNDGSIDPATEIISEKNYYPFGLEQKGYNNVVQNNNSIAEKFKFEGVELEETLGLNLYEMEWRNYDASIGRFMSIDPLAEQRNWINPYNFVQNNPILRIDPSGLIDVYGLDTETGNINLIEENDDATDTLVDNSDGSTVSENVDKGLLSDGQNIKENGLETKNVKGGLRLGYDISLHTSTEVGGIVYTDENNNKMLNLLAYNETTYNRDENGKVDGMSAGFSLNIASSWTSSDGSFTGVPTSVYHTHPGHPESNDYIGGPQPSTDDLLIANNNYYINGKSSGKFEVYRNINYYVISRKSITRNGKTSNVSRYKALGGSWTLLNRNAYKND